MRINTNVSALNAHRNLSQTQASSSESMAKLSSGFRINKAAEDAAGLGIANQMRSTTRSLVQAGRNAEQANSLLQIAEGSTGTVQKMLERMKELATQAASDTVDNDGRGRIQKEFDSLVDEIDRTVDTTKFQGTKLLDGSSASFKFMVSSSGEYGGQDAVSLSLSDLRSTALGSTGAEISTRKSVTSAGTTTGGLLTVSDAEGTLASVDDAIKQVNQQLGDIGASQNRIGYALDNVKTAIQNFSAAESVIRDVDMAEEMTKFSKANILSQAGTAMLAQANQSSQGVLQLLRG
jgi:flagellin